MRSYSGLKKKLYAIEREVIARRELAAEEGGGESRTLLVPQNQAYSAFVPLLDSELVKIDKFYQRKEAELFAQADEIERDINKLQDIPTLQRRNSASFFQKLSNIDTGIHADDSALRIHSPSTVDPLLEADANHQNPQQLRSQDGNPELNADSFTPHDVTNAYIPHDREDSVYAPSTAGVEESMLTGDQAQSTANSRRRTASFSEDGLSRRELRARARNLFILLHDLRSYAQLNFTGFSKITKKFDKVTHSDLRDTYMSQTVKAAYAFTSPAQSKLREHMEGVVYAFGLASRYSNLDDALRELKRCLREEVVWERNTVWRDMIANERM
ncbi:low-affinity phosphate transporter, partial [Coemansia brasiliensis]